MSALPSSRPHFPRGTGPTATALVVTTVGAFLMIVGHSTPAPSPSAEAAYQLSVTLPTLPSLTLPSLTLPSLPGSTTTPPTTTPPTTNPTTTAPPTSTHPTTAPPTTTPPTTAPTTTTHPTTAPPTTTPPTTTSAPPPRCTISTKLVSSCETWLGVTPRAYSGDTATEALSADEQFSGAPFSLLHQYNTNGHLFPTAEAIKLATQSGSNRLLLENWKPATDMTWAAVASGGADDRIDAEAAYLKKNFDVPFMLTIWHEPEDNVDSTSGSGNTTADYVAMYRHVVLRLRADGATKIVTVMNYTGFSKWYSIVDALYPGDDVVDWIAWDPYQDNPSGQSPNDFAGMVNRPADGFPGMYDWATSKHSSKPLMLAEWGAFEGGTDSTDGQAAMLDTVAREIGEFPQLKSLVYFDMQAQYHNGDGTAPDDSSATLAAWKRLKQAAQFNGPEFQYASGAVSYAS